jgi:hypothetical protein
MLIYIAYYIMSPWGIVLPYNTEISSALGMPRGLVCVAAGCFRLSAPGCGRFLFRSEFLSDIRVQEILEPLVAGHIHGIIDREVDGGLLVLAVDFGKLLAVDRGGAVR